MTEMKENKVMATEATKKTRKQRRNKMTEIKVTKPECEECGCDMVRDTDMVKTNMVKFDEDLEKVVEKHKEKIGPEQVMFLLTDYSASMAFSYCPNLVQATRVILKHLEKTLEAFHHLGEEHEEEDECNKELHKEGFDKENLEEEVKFDEDLQALIKKPKKTLSPFQVMYALINEATQLAFENCSNPIHANILLVNHLENSLEKLDNRGEI